MAALNTELRREADKLMSACSVHPGQASVTQGSCKASLAFSPYHTHEWIIRPFKQALNAFTHGLIQKWDF